MDNMMLKSSLTSQQMLIVQGEVTNNKKSAGVMYLLWFFFGGIGGHRYYLGDVGRGIAMTFTLGGLGLWALIDVFFIGGRLRDKTEALELKAINKVTMMSNINSSEDMPIRNKRITNIVVEQDEDDDEDMEEYKVVGVSFNNEDGKSRQAILKKCEVGDPVELKLTTYKGNPAVEVWTEHGQVGNISSDESEEVTDRVKTGKITKAEIRGIFGGTKDKPTIGCAIATS